MMVQNILLFVLMIIHVTMWFIDLLHKSNMFGKFEVYETMVEIRISKILKTVQFDNGGKFTSKEFSNFCEVHNITMQLANSYTPY
jgi:hypothetical protein